MSETNETLIFAIDIETSGPHLVKNGILSIGYCAATLNGEVLLKKRVSLSLENREFDDACRNDFWSKHEECLSKILSEQKPIKDGLVEFLNDIDELDRYYNLMIVSDCPCYDIGFVNYYLSNYVDRLPLSHKFGDASLFRPIYDTDGYSRGLLHLKYDQVWTYDSDVRRKLDFELPKNVTQSHFPDDDAEYICVQHAMMLNMIN
jgi:hypothetical protein